MRIIGPRVGNSLLAIFAVVFAMIFATKLSVAAEGVSGTITSSSREPMAHIFVQARSLNGTPVPDLGVISGTDGQYFWPLRPGRYELTFVRQGKKLASRRTSVDRAGVTRLDVRLRN